jgi:hypothetical protein
MNLIGYILPPPAATAVLAAIAAAFDVRGRPRFWSPGAYPVYTGPHAGQMFIPAGDGILDAPLLGNPRQTPQDFPEFAQLIASLGGLEARVEIDAADIISPDIETES